MICKFLIYSMLSCDGCSTGYKIYNQKIRLKTFFNIFAEDLEILKRIIVQLNNRDYD